MEALSIAAEGAVDDRFPPDRIVDGSRHGGSEACRVAGEIAGFAIDEIRIAERSIGMCNHQAAQGHGRQDATSVADGHIDRRKYRMTFFHYACNILDEAELLNLWLVGDRRQRPVRRSAASGQHDAEAARAPLP